MTDQQALFHFSIARITAAQVLRAIGIDRAASPVLDSLTDLLVRMLGLLATEAVTAAQHAGRPRPDIQDLRCALTQAGILRLTGRVVSEEVQLQEAALNFGRWITGDAAQAMRRVAGEGEDELGEASSADWLTRKSRFQAPMPNLVQKNVRAAGQDVFSDSVLAEVAKTVAGTAGEQPPENTSKRRKVTGTARAPVEGIETIARIPLEVRRFTQEHAPV